MSPLGLLVVGAPRNAAAEVEVLLSLLPARLNVPVALVLHRGPYDSLAGPLGRRCLLPVVEPDDKDELVAGHVYLAPAGYHLMVDRDSIALSREPSEHGQRPAINPLFESAADAYGPSAAGLLFSGHEDGWAGLSVLRERGGRAAVVGEGEAGEGGERVSLNEVKAWLARLSYGSRMKVQP
ncbi:chemotaxis protein CheB [Hyalangium rubrum]|uniref:protein-glutamate methylesterase n=1 Tax=Hyalangium rubrum TaxID=3103134 RepID=A0ABU5GXE2_9BACT|nr:chemotaxis protein CheB [Hyalangium sp. s54d21]MDY7225858.1 chemotaxis protein CheB [Hyalangium sp. s54d21]